MTTAGLYQVQTIKDSPASKYTSIRMLGRFRPDKKTTLSVQQYFISATKKNMLTTWISVSNIALNEWSKVMSQ